MATALLSRFLPDAAPSPSVSMSMPHDDTLHVSYWQYAASLVLALLHYLRLYGAKVLVVSLLSAMTVYRREMSSNRVYLEDEPGTGGMAECQEDGEGGDDESNNVNGRSTSSTRGEINTTQENRRPTRRTSLAQQLRDEAREAWNKDDDGYYGRDVDPTEMILEGAGNFCSGGPLLAVVLAVWAHVVLGRFITSERFDEITSEDESDNTERTGSTDNSEGPKRTGLNSVVWGAAREWVSSIQGTGMRQDDESSRRPPPSGASPRVTASGSVRLSDRIWLPRATTIDDRPGQKGSLDATCDDSTSSDPGATSPSCPLHHGCSCIASLPPDAQIHFLSYLPPRDVLSFSFVSRASRSVVHDEAHDGGTAILLWKALWKRDYAWILTEWDVGREAWQRSMRSAQKRAPRPAGARILHHLASTLEGGDVAASPDVSLSSEAVAATAPASSMKEFYFTFGHAWLNYAIAGCNTHDRCLVGLHGHVFEITDFLESHPGSPETLLVQSGRDATSFFESVGHSIGARKMALRMCAVINTNCSGGGGKGASSSCGLIRPRGMGSTIGSSGNVGLQGRSDLPIPMARSLPRRPGTLHAVRRRLDQEEHREQLRAERWLEDTLGRDCILGNIHVYFDPFVQRWKSWYTDFNFHPVFLEGIGDDMNTNS